VKWLSLLLLLCACPGTLDDPQSYLDPACPDVERDLLAVRCAGPQCHASVPQPAAGLDLHSPGVAARLMNRRARCGGLLLDPEEPEASLLYVKTGIDVPEDCPTTMPLVGDPLTDVQRACLLSWIEDAAAAQ
jgi:hypothetical protein